jgi:hypothetical protein
MAERKKKWFLKLKKKTNSQRMGSEQYAEIVRKNRVRQSLAQLSLEGVEDQFPVRFAQVLDPSGSPTSMENIALRRLQQSIKQIGVENEDALRRLIEKYTGEKVLTGEIEKSFLFPQSTTVPILSDRNLEPNTTGRLFDISAPLSHKTAQGTAYNIDVHLNSTLHIVRILSEEFGIRANIPAVMKKSPIYNIRDWFKYNLVRELYKQYDYIQDDPNIREEYRNLIKFYLDRRNPNIYLTSGRDYLDMVASTLYGRLLTSYNEME